MLGTRNLQSLTVQLLSEDHTKSRDGKMQKRIGHYTLQDLGRFSRMHSWRTSYSCRTQMSYQLINWRFGKKGKVFFIKIEERLGNFPRSKFKLLSLEIFTFIISLNFSSPGQIQPTVDRLVKSKFLIKGTSGTGIVCRYSWSIRMLELQQVLTLPHLGLEY